MNKRNKKLVLNRETISNLQSVRGAYCSNSTLSAQVSICDPPTQGLDCKGTPAKAECPTPIN